MEKEKPLSIVIAYPGQDAREKALSAAAHIGLRIAGTAETLPEALSLAKRTRPDLLLAHILLPGLTESFFRENRVLQSLEKRPGVIYAYPTGANALMTGGYSPLIPALTDERTLQSAVQAAYPAKPFAEEVLRIRRVLSLLGTEDGRGMEFLVYAAGLCLVNSENARLLSKRVFPEIARVFGATKKQAESAMQRTVEKAFLLGDIETQYALFGNTIDAARGKPTLSAFLARVCEILRFREDESL